MANSNRLTMAELEAVIGVAGDALAAETLSTEDNPQAALDTFESGLDKLRAQLARHERRTRTRGGKHG